MTAALRGAVTRLRRRWSLRTQLAWVVLGGVLAAYVVTAWLLIPVAKSALRDRIDTDLVRDLPAVREAVATGDENAWREEYRVVLVSGGGRGATTGTSDAWARLGPTGPTEVAPALVDGTPYRYLAVPVVTGDDTTDDTMDDAGNVAGGDVLVVAAPTDDLDDLVDTLVSAFLVIGGVTTTALAAVTWWWLHHGLRPLERLAAGAAAVAGGDPRGSLAVPARSREVSVLVTALDDMLGSLQAALREREAGEQRMRTFVADASHELRSPLTTVSGYLELDLRDGLSDRAGHDEAMGRALSEARRMRRIVGDLQLLAELDAERPLARRPVDIAALAAEAVADAGATDPDRRYVLDRPPAGEPTTILADLDAVRQIVGNVLANVRSHTPSGTTARVSVSGVEPGGVRLEVVDDGPGVPPDEVAHVTERFWRLDPSRSRRTGGSGLGMAVVAGLVARLGGTVAVGSGPPGGLRVTVRLPAARPDDRDSPDGAAGPGGAAGTAAGTAADQPPTAQGAVAAGS